MGLRDVGATLPPGFRFYPNDEELVCHYLHKKIANEEALKGTLVEIDLHTCEPWQLPEVAKLNTSEWYFFSFRDRKYATGYRTNRATTSGYWKATGKDRVILDPKTKEVVGMRKTLVFYRNRAPNGVKTGWIMHEFRLESPHMPPKEDWVLCRVFHKGKEENKSNNYNQCQYMFDYQTTAISTSSPPPLVGSPSCNTNHHHSINHCGYHHHDQQPNSFSLINPSFPQKPIINNNDPNQNGVNTNNNVPLNPNNNNFLNLSRENSSNYTLSDLLNMNVKNDEDYDQFVWGLNMEESSKFGDIRFEDDNGTVFI